MCLIRVHSWSVRHTEKKRGKKKKKKEKKEKKLHAFFFFFFFGLAVVCADDLGKHNSLVLMVLVKTSGQRVFEE